MNWGGWSEFWHMNGYAFYVWSAYGVTALFLIVEIIMVRRKKQQIRKRLARLARMSNNAEK
jgi:heme exporter protein D